MTNPAQAPVPAHTLLAQAITALQEEAAARFTAFTKQAAEHLGVTTADFTAQDDEAKARVAKLGELVREDALRVLLSNTSGWSGGFLSANNIEEAARRKAAEEVLRDGPFWFFRTFA